MIGKVSTNTARSEGEEVLHSTGENLVASGATTNGDQSADEYRAT
jgi:hypothetical protein